MITQNSGCSSPLPAQFLSTEISRNFIYTYTPLYKAFYRGILSEWVCVNTYIKTSLQRRFCAGLIALRALKAEVPALCSRCLQNSDLGGQSQSLPLKQTFVLPKLRAALCVQCHPAHFRSPMVGGAQETDAKMLILMSSYWRPCN